MKRIAVDNVNFSYEETLILENLTIHIEPGDFVCILGESGAGKSTLLRLIAGLIFPASGTVTVDGQEVDRPGLDRGVVFQDYGLYPWMTTGKNIMIAMKQRYPKMAKEEIKNKIMYYLAQVGLDAGVYNKYPNELSGGMRQRCALCRSFALDSPVLLMDEPFGALDAVTRYRLQDMLKKLCAAEGHQKKTVVFVTHDVDEAMYLSTKIFVLGLKPSKVIYSYEFKGKEENTLSRNDLFQKPEYVKLREELMDILNKDIEERAKENEQEISGNIGGSAGIQPCRLRRG